MSKSKLTQVLTALILHYNCLLVGFTIGWPSSMMLLFNSEETPLNRPMTNNELSWFGSLPFLGSLFGIFTIGVLMDKLGRKLCCLIVAGIESITWLLFMFSAWVELTLTAAFIAGFNSSGILVMSIFVSEFSEESLRGCLTSACMVFNGFGLLVAYVFGGFLSYKTVLYLGPSMTFVGAMLLMVMKESPLVLLNKGMQEEARISMGFYRNSHPESRLVSQELEKIRRILSPAQQELLSCEEKRLNSKNESPTPCEKPSLWKSIKNSRATQRALSIQLMLISFCLCQGMVVIQTYAKVIFSATIPADVLSATWCSVMLTSVIVFTGLVGAYLTDHLGRRTLMFISSTTCGVWCILIGTQIHLHWGPDWLTVLFFMLYCASFSVGAGVVPLAFSAEIFLPDVKCVLTMIFVEWNFLGSFMVIFVCNTLAASIGLGPVFFIFSIMCFLTTAFVYFFMPETKGLTLEEIQMLFEKPVKRNII